MNIARQGKLFLIIGIVQWLVDSGITIALSHAGLALEAANVAGRISGAMLGFWLNGKITFAHQHASLGRSQLLRFITLWLALTLVSTWAVGGIGRHASLQAAWLAKPLVEIVLAVVSFFVSRHWVYR